MSEASQDRVVRIGRSLVQHDALNRRVYLMKLAHTDMPGIVEKLDALAQAHDYTKIFARIPSSCAAEFLRCDYEVEASIPGLYDGGDHAVFMGKYLDAGRREYDAATCEETLRLARRKAGDGVPLAALPAPYRISEATRDDVQDLAALFRTVFERYPFPVHDPAYLADTMASHVDLFCVRHGDRIVAASAAEKDPANGCAEMTDFATLPEHRGHRFAEHLLRYMDREEACRHVRIGYTIARATSAGMNITFARCGYVYAGRLINNTWIGSGIESMHVWYKRLPGKPPRHGQALEGGC